MAYGERTDEREFSFSYQGEEVDAKCVLYEGYGNHPEVDVNIYIEENHSKSTFRVTSLEDRECVFRKASGDGRSKPSDMELIALQRYGWYCSNYSPESVVDEQAKLLPTLQRVDDQLGAVLRKRYDAVEKFPFIYDAIELGMSGVALANSMLYEANGIGDGDVEQGLTHLLEQEDYVRQKLLAFSVKDEYFRQIIPPLAEETLDITITQEEIENAEISDFPPEMQAYLRDSSWDAKSESEINMDNLGELAVEAGSHEDNLKSKWETRVVGGDTKFGHIMLRFYRIAGADVNTPFVFNRNDSDLPFKEEARAEVVTRKFISNLNDDAPPYFSFSVEEAFELLDDIQEEQVADPST